MEWTVTKLGNGWYSDWEVASGDARVLVKTVDIYEYQCTLCQTLARCPHERAVRERVAADMDAYARERLKIKMGS